MFVVGDSHGEEREAMKGGIFKGGGFQRTRLALAGLFALACLPLAVGCSSLFDSPRGTESGQQAIAANKVTELAASNNPVEVLAATGQSEAEQRAAAAAAQGQKSGQQALADTLPPNRKNNAPPDKTNKIVVKPGSPTLVVEHRADIVMPQLAVLGLDNATLLVDGRPVELGNITPRGRIALVAPGRHSLSVKCPHDPPFTVDVTLVKGNLVDLRGLCSPPSPKSN